MIKMNELEQIKQVEEEAAKAVERARQDSEAKIAGAKSQSGQKIQKAIDAAKKEIAEKVAKTEAEAKKQAEKLTTSGKSEVSTLTAKADKRKGDAVKLIIDEIRGD
jgi:vacuolar-type H+-ATPase subunit H